MFKTRIRLYVDQYRRHTKVKVWKVFGLVVWRRTLK
jgi:hypothetical protein